MRLAVLIQQGISIPGFVLRIPGVVLSIGQIPIGALGAVTGISITIAVLLSVGTIALIEIVPIVIVLISFLLPHHILIHRPLTYHSYHWPLSLPLVYQHLLSITLLLFILQQHHLLLMSTPIASPRPVRQGSLLENLWMESSSPTLCYPSSMSPLPSIGENSVDENVPEHV